MVTEPAKGSVLPYSRLRTDSVKHESFVLLSPSAPIDGGLLPTHPPVVASSPFLTFFARGHHLQNFFKGLLSNSLRLLVAVSVLLSKEDHESLCPFLWQSCLTQVTSEIQSPVGLHLIGAHPTGIDSGSTSPRRRRFCLCSAQRKLRPLF